MNLNINTYKNLSDKDFLQLSDFIYKNYGIKMPISKKVMLQARLQSRLREKNIATFEEYIEYIFSNIDGQEEIIKMIDVVSTNKTDFFREPKHFEFMTEHLLPKYNDQTIKIWSSASSSGEEAYSIAITINEYSQKYSKINYSILGTDISTRILEKAQGAIYSESRIDGVPIDIKRKYFLKSKNRETPTVRVIPELRSKTQFTRLNLIDDLYTDIPMGFDIIFCRNVLIYFDRETQEKVINKLCRHLNTGGYFFLGHSESITGLNVPLKQIKPTIFTKI